MDDEHEDLEAMDDPLLTLAVVISLDMLEAVVIGGLLRN
jgi:hypothetical protein